MISLAIKRNGFPTGDLSRQGIFDLSMLRYISILGIDGHSSPDVVLGGGGAKP